MSGETTVVFPEDESKDSRVKMGSPTGVDLKKVESWLLKNVLIEEGTVVPEIVGELLNAEYDMITSDEFCLLDVERLPNDENLETNVSDAIKAAVGAYSHLEWLCTGVASLLRFVRCNWINPEIREEVDWLSIMREQALRKLSMDDECNANLSRPELLYFAKAILSNEELQETFDSANWWLLRANLLHQIVLEESSATLFKESEELILKIQEFDFLRDPLLATIFNLEATQFYLCYRRVANVEKHLEIARTTAMLDLEPTGAMGKRTKYQADEKAQLRLSIRLGKEPFPFRSCEDLPKALDLNDDLRLERIEFSEPGVKVELGAVEEAVVLAKFFHLQISQPKDKLADEELVPYLTEVLEGTKNWSLKMSCLYQRCLLEANHKRTIERSMLQMEYLIEQLNDVKVPVPNKLDLFFASGLRPAWDFKRELANLMLNLGMVKGALEIYLNLQLWEDVIVCYTLLDLRHKAAEVIRREISKKPTVKLWCLLGDATQETDCYETAWKLSGEASSRAQRHWGFYYYAKKNYVEAVPHLKLSAELNNIQESVWIRLGFAALQIGDWKLAALAYRRYCALDQMNFEAWNNLAQAYVKLGDKSRARRSLEDAVKCNYDRWEVWDNLMIVSVDLGHFSDVIRCYHRILELKGAHVDIPVLDVLTKAIVANIEDADGNPSQRLVQKVSELFGHLTSIVPSNSDIWRMYAEVSAIRKTDLDDQKTAQYLQRAHRCAVANPRWFQTAETTRDVLKLCSSLATAYLNCTSNCTDVQKRAMLGSAKLSLRGVVKKAKDQRWSDSKEIEEDIEKVEELLRTVADELDKINVQN